MKKKDRCAICGLVEIASPHRFGHEFESTSEKPAFGQQRQSLRARSERPNRVQRYEDGQQAMQAHREAVRYCEAPGAGIETPCGTGPDATIEQSHVIGKGMGGGKDYGIVRSLCRKHHRELDEDRPAFRRVGLSQRAPVPAKVAPRRASAFKNRKAGG